MPKKSNGDIVIGALAVSAFSIGGWLVFTAVTGMFDLSSLSDSWRLVLGLIIILSATKLGLRKLIK